MPICRQSSDQTKKREGRERVCIVQGSPLRNMVKLNLSRHDHFSVHLSLNVGWEIRQVAYHVQQTVRSYMQVYLYAVVSRCTNLYLLQLDRVARVKSAKCFPLFSKVRHGSLWCWGEEAVLCR